MVIFGVGSRLGWIRAMDYMVVGLGKRNLARELIKRPTLFFFF